PVRDAPRAAPTRLLLRRKPSGSCGRGSQAIAARLACRGGSVLIGTPFRPSRFAVTAQWMTPAWLPRTEKTTQRARIHRCLAINLAGAGGHLAVRPTLEPARGGLQYGGESQLAAMPSRPGGSPVIVPMGVTEPSAPTRNSSTVPVVPVSA